MTTSNIFSLVKETWPVKKPIDWVEAPCWFGTAPQLRRLLTSSMSVLEIGAWVGHSTKFLAENSSFVITIDPWFSSREEYNSKVSIPLRPDNPLENKVASQLPHIYNTFLINCWEQKEKILPVKKLSEDGLPFVASLGYLPDLIYIDGNHSYKNVLADIRTAKKFFPRAILCGDDYGWSGGDEELPIQRAVKECAKEFGQQIEAEWFWRLL